MVFLTTSCIKEKVIHRACPDGLYYIDTPVTSIVAGCKMRKREVWNYLMKFAFRLRFTRVFVSLARAVHYEPFATLLICQRFSLLHFPMRTKTIFNDNQAYSVFDFPSTKPPFNSQRRSKKNKRVGNLQRVRHLGSFR